MLYCSPKYLKRLLGPFGTGGSFRGEGGVKRPVIEANHLRPSSGEVMNAEMTCISTPPIHRHDLYMEKFCCLEFYIMHGKVTFELCHTHTHTHTHTHFTSAAG